ncbi:MAG TPA: hypothetical protein VGZ47_05175 [Gemmataceae bacterium]|jgi:LSD1 subclass zinc finger protein|nr:hypothetical protein [Gemmataceae bacterium]
MFIVNCANCNEPLRLPDDAAGKTIRCLKCKVIILVPEKPPKPEGVSYGAETTDFVEKKPPSGSSGTRRPKG